MATTTTIYADSDTFIAESASTTNYGNNNRLKVGIYAGDELKNSILEFDVSAITSPADIVSAILTLTQTISYGSNAHTATIARLSQDYVEVEATWEIASTGVGWTGGDGASGDAETTTLPTYSMLVGNNSGTQTIDIRELVIDAIQRRSGVLRILCFCESGTGTGNTNFASSNDGTAVKRPVLSVKVADRLVWAGTMGDGDASDYRNWTPDTLPTADDYAIFSSGSEDVTSGSITCDRIYIGKSYKGNIGTSLQTTQVTANRLGFSTAISKIHIHINPLGSVYGEARIHDTTSRSGEFRLVGRYNTTVFRTRQDINLQNTYSERIDAHSRKARFTAAQEPTVARITSAFATLEDGAGTLTASNRAVITMEADDNTAADIVVGGNSMVRCLAAQFDDGQLYSGLLSFAENTGSPVLVGELSIYSNFVVNTRNGAGTFTTTRPSNLRGGRMLFDGSQAITIT